MINLAVVVKTEVPETELLETSHPATREPADAEACFGLGMAYSAGAGMPVDLIEAHKWFNIAAMRGHREAAQLRREVAEQMADSEIGSAQRAARDWLKLHPTASVEQLRVAA